MSSKLNIRIQNLLNRDFLQDLIGHVKLKMCGVSYERVSFLGSVDVRCSPDAAISLKDARFGPFCEIWAGPNGSIKIGRQFACENNVRINCRQGALDIGDNIRVGAFSIINCFNDIQIGSDSLLSSNVHIIDSDHGIAKGCLIRTQCGRASAIRIGRDVWIGNGVTILKGVEIGDGSVVGAGSVVTKDIASNSIAVGVPAKAIKKRP